MSWVPRYTLVTIVFAMACLPSSAIAAEPPRFGEWLVRCVQRPGLPPCDVVQTVKDPQTHQPVMQISYSYAPGRDSYAAQYQLPVGFMLPAGVLIRLDGKTKITDYPVSRCEVEGCFVERLVKSAELNPFRKAKKGEVIMMGKDGKPISIPFEVSGFGDAIDAMVARNKAEVKAR